MTRLDYQRLMQLYDGELTVEEASSFRAQLREAGLDAEADEVAAGLDQVGDVVRALTESEGRDRAGLTDGIADDVLREIEAERRATDPRQSGSASSGWGWAAGASGVLALAAGVLLFLWSSTGPTDGVGGGGWAVGQGPAGNEEPQAVASARPQLAAGGEADPGVAIEMVDFGAQNGTIFMVSSGEEAATPVVWLVDEGPDIEGRVEQL